MPIRATVKARLGCFQGSRGGFQIVYTFNFLLSFKSSQLCPMVMRGNYSAVTLSNPSDDFASVLTCVILCMPLSSQIERKRKRSTGAAWNRTLEGSAFAECPICSRRASPVYLFVCALQPQQRALQCLVIPGLWLSGRLGYYQLTSGERQLSDGLCPATGCKPSVSQWQQRYTCHDKNIPAASTVRTANCVLESAQA